MKSDKKIVGFGKKHFMRILRFLIIVLFILIMILVFKNYYPLIFIPIVIYWYISIFKQVNVCIFKKDKIYVKSDNTNSFEHLQVQKAFEIHYSEIELIEIINSRYKNTRGEDYLIGFDGRLLTSEDILSEKTPYYQRSNYSKLDLEILKINLKNTNKFEGIVLTPFSSKKKKQIIKELSDRI